MKADGNPLLAGHIKHQRYEFSGDEADQLLAEFRAQHGQPPHVTRPARSFPAKPAPQARPATGNELPGVSEGPGHRVQALWMGETVTTLNDLLRPGLFAVVVGINPAPPSVKTGP